MVNKIDKELITNQKIESHENILRFEKIYSWEKIVIGRLLVLVAKIYS